jgi:hypothetical protein
MASQRSRACKEVMEDRRDIIFPVAARLIWDGPPPEMGEGRLGANPTSSDCAPMPSGKTTLE